jgi:outer membrane receptor protein involved in Fe transport
MNSNWIRKKVLGKHERTAGFSSAFPERCGLLLGAAWFLLAIAGVPSVAAQEARVEGIVRDSSGASVEGARVELHASSYAATASTDASGAFAFERVSEVSGTITVTAKGFAKSEKAWSVTSGSQARLEFVLALEAPNQSVVVTSARAPTLLGDVPTTDIELTHDDLQVTPALELDDSLRQVPGFSLFRRSSSRTANPTTQGISLRGLGANGASRALVLEDGIPLNDPFGAWVYWDRVPSESIASVEIAQEGASSLYGSDALGGVVQILTRPAEPAGISLETSYGNQNSPNLSLWAGGEKNGWFSTIGGGVFHTDGYVLIPQADRGTVDTKAGVSDATADLTIGRKIGEQSEIFARGWYLDESRGNGTPLQINNTQIGQGALGANLALGDFGTLTLRFYGDAQTYHQNFSAVSANRNSETITDQQTVPSQGVGGSAVWSRTAGKRQTLVAGFDDQEEIGHTDDLLFTTGVPSSTLAAGGRQRTVGVFGEDLIKIAPRWLLTISGRFDYWRNFDAFMDRTPLPPPSSPAITPFADRSENAFSPRMTLRNQLTSNISWNASIYRAFRAPTLNELYRTFRQGNIITGANDNLTAERLTGGEAGVAAEGFNRRLEVRGAFFFNEIINPVANVTCVTGAPPPCPTTLPTTVITRVRENLGRTTAPGFEINVTSRITHEFEISTGYQFVAATVSSFPAETSLVGLWVAQVPRNVLTFQARYTNPRVINVSVNGRMVGKQFDDDLNQFPLGRFFVLDVMASRAVGSGVEIFAAAENLLNEKYATEATPILQLGLPITARFGLRFEFPRR